MIFYRAKLALLALLLAGTATAAPNPEPLAPDQQKTVDSLRQYAMAYTANLPNFICTQVTNRDQSTEASLPTDDSGMVTPNHGPSDTIVEKLTYFNQQENYEVLTIKGVKAVGVQHTQLDGATSSGEFGSAMRSIFDPESHTVFTWHKPASLRGRHVYVVGYQVPQEYGVPVTALNNLSALVAYKGEIFADTETLEILRITTDFKLPPGFPIESAHRFVDYRQMPVAGKNYNLPFHSEVSLVHSATTFYNKIDFKDYRKFAVESTLRFGELPDPASLPSAGPAPAPETTANATQPPTTTQPPAVGPAPQPPPAPAPEIQPANHTEPSPAQSAVLAVAPPPATSALPPAPTPGAAPAPFHLTLGADLVLVPVVVRDAAGHTIPNLTKDDFQLYDKGKRQQIVDINLETATSQSSAPASTASAAASTVPTAPPSEAAFTAYLIDDIHLKIENLVQVREAVRRHIAALPPDRRVAIITTSGSVTSPMTTDRKQLNDALDKLHAEALGGSESHQCPNIDYFMAESIVNSGISNPAFQAATAEAFVCLHLDPDSIAIAQRLAQLTAKNVDLQGERQTRAALLQIRDVVRWLANAPGRRTLILVSPGFILNNSARFDEAELIDQAIRAQVTISALDARGVYDLSPAGKIENTSSDPDASRIQSSLASDEAIAVAGVMSEVSYGTGGAFVQNTNDLYAGLDRLATPPETTYILAFRPSALKSDGSYHPLEVKLGKKSNVTLQSRKGYFAPHK